MRNNNGDELEKLLILVVGIILGCYTCKIFMGYFWTCTILGIIGLIIGLFAFVNWLIDYKRRKGRRSKKKYIKVIRILFILFSVGIISFVYYKRGPINEKFKEWSRGISEYTEVFISEKGKLGLRPNRQGIMLKFMDNMNYIK